MDPITIIIAIVAWLGGAAVTGRNDYAREQREWLAVRDSEEARGERMAEINAELKGMHHDICNLNYSSMRNLGCDCGKKNKWKKLHEELDALQEGGPVGRKPGPQYHNLVSWPFTAIHNFMTPTVELEPKVNIEEIVAKAVEEVKPKGKPFTSEEFSTVLQDPWGHLRPNDEVAAKIKGEWKNIHATYQADLEAMKVTGQDVHGVEYDDKYVIMDDNGKVVKTYTFEEPILIGVGGGSPKAPKKGRRTTSTGPR